MQIGSTQHSFESYASVLTLDHQWQLQLMGAVPLLMHPVLQYRQSYGAQLSDDIIFSITNKMYVNV